MKPERVQVQEIRLVRPSRWSYSALSTYEACPAQYKYSYLDDLPRESGPYAERGTRLHSAAEDFLNGSNEMLPNDFKHVLKHMEELREKKAQAEAVVMATKDWGITEDKNEAWVKAIVDAHYLDGDDRLRLVDFKTGRWYPDHAKQLQLYAVLMFLKYPEVRRIDVSALYIDQGFYDSQNTYIRTMFEPLKADWERRAQVMYNDNDFLPTPSKNACNWCSYKAGKPCKASK